MVRDDLRNLMLWVVAVVLILEHSKCHITEIAWERHEAAIAEKQKRARNELNADEIKDFMRLWPQFNKLHLNKEAYSSFSVEKEELDWPSRIWFVYHQWDAERFSYVYKRLNELLKAMDVQRHSEAIIKQLGARTDDISREMVKTHQKRIQELDLNDAEVKRVEEHETELKKLFKLYP
ncbi:MAG: hypothetical protein IJ824_01935 [Alphaproteobacteria bacterium]|nr:hypothetical protein [Alphaproteobacteria bacterium]